MYRRISKYVPGFDGTRIAVDLYLPETDEKVPVLFQVTNGERRARTDTEEGKKREEDMLDQYEFFLNHNYAVCRMEPRGVGASFGVSEGFWSVKDAKDMKAVIDQVASEDWCSGNAGMFGGSNVGASQHYAANQLPEHLKCIIPCDCSADFYYQNYPNGVSIMPEIKRPKMQPVMGIPVDDDPAPDYPMANEALQGHYFNMGFLEQYTTDMHRDDVNPKIGYAPNMEIPVWEHMDVLRHGHIAPYMYGAFFDPGCTNKVFEYKAWGGKLILGPWRHVEVYHPANDMPEQEIGWKEDHLKFFDRHLKGIENDTDEMPPVRYYTVHDEKPWHYAADFPTDFALQTPFYLTQDGKLSDHVPEKGALDYKIRNDIHIFDSMGRLNRRVEKDLSDENDKCLVFTTEPLDKDTEITGFPTAELYVTSENRDGIFMAVLEEVTEDGVSHMITDGMIRGRSSRLGRNAMLNSMGLPYHTSLRKDDAVLASDTEVPTFLAFHLEVTSRIIKKGSRIRFAVYCGGNGFNQPEGVSEGSSVRFHLGEDCPALLRLPVIAPHVSEFTDGIREVCVFRRAVFIRDEKGFKKYDCLQAYPYLSGMCYVTEKFSAFTEEKDGVITLKIESSEAVLGGFSASVKLPDRKIFEQGDPRPVRIGDPREVRHETLKGYHHQALYVGTVPARKEEKGGMNPQPVNTLDLYVDLVKPEGDGPFPCIVHIHGFGGSNQDFEPITGRLIEKGYAAAGVDYRLMPPNIWPSSGLDARGCIRYLKAHAHELGLDPERFGLIGGSMGGHLTAMLAACNGDRSVEGDIGGNTEYDSSIKAAVALYAPTDFFTFGEDCAAQWPYQPDKVANGDGPYAPLGSMLGYTGPGKGMGEIKHHLFSQDVKYRKLIEEAREASPVCHVTENSAPLCLVHGMFDYGVQVPMGQSLKMFEALTRVGVKSLVLLNNNGPYGADPEVQDAEIDFLTMRV